MTIKADVLKEIPNSRITLTIEALNNSEKRQKCDHVYEVSENASCVNFDSKDGNFSEEGDFHYDGGLSEDDGFDMQDQESMYVQGEQIPTFERGTDYDIIQHNDLLEGEPTDGNSSTFHCH